MSNKKIIILMSTVFVLTLVVEVFLFLGTFVTLKYNIENAGDVMNVISAIYELVENIIIVALINLVYLFILHLIFFRKLLKK